MTDVQSALAFVVEMKKAYASANEAGRALSTRTPVRPVRSRKTQNVVVVRARAHNNGLRLPSDPVDAS